MNYKLTVGLEIHVEIDSDSKMFCGCKNNTDDQPNTNVCPVCLGLPGALPVPNLLAVEKTIALGISLGGKIAHQTKWDRKNYFYPDLPKGYQISQYDEPLIEGGKIKVGKKDILLTRIHLEEDTGKLTHPKKSSLSLIDLNRAGAPLLEMVTEPVISSADEAKEFCQEFQKILRHLNISSAEMEKGKMRCEANVSVAKESDKKLGNKVEVKNLNSFRSVKRAIEYEFKRQVELLKAGKYIAQETRGWNENRQTTFLQRTKESAHDYRYFPEPDIPRIKIFKLIKKIKSISSSDLPETRRINLINNFSVSSQEAEIIIKDNILYSYFLEVMKKLPKEINGRIVASWMIHSKFKNFINQDDFIILLKKVYAGEMNDTTARMIAKKIIDGKKLSELLKEHKMLDEKEIKTIIKKVLKDHPQAHSDFKSGKSQAIQFLFGRLMKESRGQIDSKIARELLEKELI